MGTDFVLKPPTLSTEARINQKTNRGQTKGIYMFIRRNPGSRLRGSEPQTNKQPANANPRFGRRSFLKRVSLGGAALLPAAALLPEHASADHEKDLQENNGSSFDSSQPLKFSKRICGNNITNWHSETQRFKMVCSRWMKTCPLTSTKTHATNSAIRISSTPI